MTTRFIRVCGHKRDLRENGLFEYLRNTRVTRQKGYNILPSTVPCAIFLSALVAFLPSPSSSYHHGSVSPLIRREIMRKSTSMCSLSESRKSRSFNTSNANENLRTHDFPRVLCIYVPYLIIVHSFADAAIYIYIFNDLFYIYNFNDLFYIYIFNDFFYIYIFNDLYFRNRLQFCS